MLAAHLPTSAQAQGQPQRRCGLLLLPGGAPLIAGLLAQWLALATDLAPEGASPYAMHWLSPGGHALAAWPGPRTAFEDLLDGPPAQGWHALFVLAGSDLVLDESTLAALRQHGVVAQSLIGLDAGAMALAEAGFLRGRRATVCWPLLDTLRQDFPEVVWSDRLWEGEQGVWTCAGGLAAADMLAAWLGATQGDALNAVLLDSLGWPAWRERDERQQRPATAGLGASPKLREALALMDANLSEPLPTEDIARLVGVSRRQLERLFRQHLDALPSRYYAELRLQRARRLLQQSSQSILQIGLSCGFASGSHFSNAYKAFFGHTPRDERSQRVTALRSAERTAERVSDRAAERPADRTAPRAGEST